MDAINWQTSWNIKQEFYRDSGRRYKQFIRFLREFRVLYCKNMQDEKAVDSIFPEEGRYDEEIDKLIEWLKLMPHLPNISGKPLRFKFIYILGVAKTIDKNNVKTVYCSVNPIYNKIDFFFLFCYNV